MPPYILYLNLIENTIQLIAQLISIFLFMRLIYYGHFNHNRLKAGNISFSMFIFFYIHVICSSLSLFDAFYVVVAWHPGDLIFLKIKYL